LRAKSGFVKEVENEALGKTQVLADIETQEILCTAQAKGAVHKPVLRLSIRAILWGILLLADSGYQGLLSLHKNNRIVYKKSKNRPLTVEQKLFNRTLSKERIVIENINTRIKTFKILSERYRNRRKRHLLRMNLVCAILNRELIC